MRGLLKLLMSLCVGISAFGQALEEYPDTISIDNMENIFGPVQFSHGKHARMVGMGEGCTVCHHYAEDDDYTGCAECHMDNPEEATLEEPTINGAYHRSCLACHREWSNEQTCETCHQLKRFRFNVRKTLDKTDIFSIKHPHIGSPEVVSFSTPKEHNSIVTFHHSEHIDLYRYDCVTCHRSESCQTCHDYQGPAELVEKTLEQHHQPCNNCHDVESGDGCTYCHKNELSEGFTHELVGWSLEKYHVSNECSMCHGNQKPIQKVSTDCLDCHNDFEPGLFEHIRTGFQLSEDHLEIDCYECHNDAGYSDLPVCLECHEEDYVFPHFMPGQYVNEK